MRVDWPLMQLVWQAHWGAAWAGPLTPFDRNYQVSLRFYFGLTLGGCDLANWGPELRVLQPDMFAECAPGIPPHLYASDDQPLLCLFDPTSEDWNFDKPLSKTIMPWAAQWLGFYELWKATGRWTGPERHPEPRRVQPNPQSHAAPNVALPQASSLCSLDRLCRQVAAATGTECSAPVIRTAAAGRLPSLARDWLSGPRLPVRPYRQLLGSSAVIHERMAA